MWQAGSQVGMQEFVPSDVAPAEAAGGAGEGDGKGGKGEGGKGGEGLWNGVGWVVDRSGEVIVEKALDERGESIVGGGRVGRAKREGR